MQLVPLQQTARQLSLALLVVVVMSLSAVSVFAQSPTFVRTDYPGLGNNQVAADFNGDGTFRQPPLLLTEPGINVPQYQAVADYNGDGFQDLALALANGNSGLMEILNGNGDGTFQPPVYYLKPPEAVWAVQRRSLSLLAEDNSGPTRWR